MTTMQKESIVSLRVRGNSYSEIAGQLGITRNAVISFCRRKHIQKPMQNRTDNSLEHCRQCGSPLIQQEKMKRRVFCCDECRIKWWSEHPEMLNKKAIYSFVCANCGKTFSAYGDSGRKYCSHECYIEDRFG